VTDVRRNAAIAAVHALESRKVDPSVEQYVDAVLGAVFPPEVRSPPSPLGFSCRDCGAPMGERCQALEGDHPRAMGYHPARYADAGWPPGDDDD
jgi:hypothetical protein